MKISKMSFSATIPTQQFGNIQPSIEFSDIAFEGEAQEAGIKFIKDLYSKFSANGELKERVVEVKSSLSEIKKIAL